MAAIEEIISLMCRLFPEENYYDKEYDNIGLLVGSKNGETDTVLCCLDVSKEVIAEAAELNAKLIISHHPVIYYPVKSVTDTDPVGDNIIRLIRQGITVYSAHTNMDFSCLGINRYGAEQIGLKNLRPIEPYINQNEGYGIIGELEKKEDAEKVLKRVKQAFNDQKASLYGTDKPIKTVAFVCGGAGGDTSFIDKAVKMGADCFISGDIKHHVALYAKSKAIALIEAQHYHTEHSFLPRLAEILNDHAKKENLSFRAVASKSETNPRIY